MNYKLLIIIVLLAAVLLAPLSYTKSPTMIRVGNGQFSTIQAAVDAAQPGDTILVNEGIYYENVVVNKAVTLQGRNSPTVDGMQKDNCFLVTASNVVITGFIITNATTEPYYHSGVYVNGVSGCTVSDNTINFCGQAVILQDSTGCTVYNNNVHENTEGIGISGGSGNTVSTNSIVAPQATLTGIGLMSTGNTIIDNSVENCKYGIGGWWANSNTITGNTISYSEYGIYLEGSNSNLLSNNKLNYNTNPFAQPGSTNDVSGHNNVVMYYL